MAEVLAANESAALLLLLPALLYGMPPSCAPALNCPGPAFAVSLTPLLPFQPHLGLLVSEPLFLLLLFAFALLPLLLLLCLLPWNVSLVVLPLTCAAAPLQPLPTWLPIQPRLGLLVSEPLFLLLAFGFALVPLLLLLSRRVALMLVGAASSAIFRPSAHGATQHALKVENVQCRLGVRCHMDVMILGLGPLLVAHVALFCFTK